MMEVAIYISSVFLGLGVLLAVYRLGRGPDVIDRVVALDLIGLQVIGVIALYCMYVKSPVYLDIAIVSGLVSFLWVVAIAKYVLDRRVE